MITLRLANTLVLINEQTLQADQKQKGQMWKEGLKVNHEIKERKMIKRNEDILSLQTHKKLKITTLTACPVPTCPQCVMDFPMKAKTFCAASKSSALSAPTMKVRVPAAAALTPPETGASTKMAPLAFAASDIALLTAGSIVLLSIKRAPG